MVLVPGSPSSWLPALGAWAWALDWLVGWIDAESSCSSTGGIVALARYEPQISTLRSQPGAGQLSSC